MFDRPESRHAERLSVGQTRIGPDGPGTIVRIEGDAVTVQKPDVIAVWDDAAVVTWPLGESRCSLSADQSGQMMLQSVRYALGRRTSVPADTKNAVTCAWSAIPKRWQDLIERDVRGELERAESHGNTVGDRCDHDRWVELRDWIGEMRATAANLL